MAVAETGCGQVHLHQRNTRSVCCTRRRCILTIVSRTNIDIDDALIELAMRRYGVHTKTEAVDRALREVAFTPMTTAEILALHGGHFVDDAPADQPPPG